MSKRDPSTDIPRRIYQSTIERIDKHLLNRPKKNKRGKLTAIKGDFNKFLVDMLNVYEELQKTEIYYANTLYTDPSEARGEAILIARKMKQPVKPPQMVIAVGEDEEL